MKYQVRPGKANRLGAVWDGKGTNFAVFSENAEGVDLCLFDRTGAETRVALTEVHNYVWHAYIPGVGPGQRYGYRARGPFDPKEGQRFNAHKLLIDPYARALDGDIRHHPDIFGYPHKEPITDLRQSTRDDSDCIPKAIVTDGGFDWQGDRRLEIPWHDTIVYEVHVKGFTCQMPDVPAALRGTYAGLAHPAAIAHLQDLGVTAIELLPVHHYVAYPGHLAEKGLRNYWGYDSIAYFAPYSGYCSAGADPVVEFKAMVRTLHAAGMEVILDVVYNHTGEGNHLGPTLSLRGLDNIAYYRLVDGDPRYYMDFTGCGNSLNVRHPQILKLIMDSLRYWVEEMHVDGFRFDLAAALARELYEVDSLAAFFDIIHQDPILSDVKLIAEPWDVGDGGYQVGNFPLLWSEWNGKYRDTVRDFWRGCDSTLAEFAYRFTGSSDLYAANGRRPHASINFVTAHDGFTLRDLVSYNEKHNHANGEDNRDGDDHNRSWNCGAEGETGDPEILALRSRQQLNFLTTLMLSQGVPMLLGGDEIGRSQGGNNNVYCQDSEIAWFDWELSEERLQLLDFARKLIAFRKAHPNFHRRDWFQGRELHGSGVDDIGWYHADGSAMTEEQWNDNATKALAVFLNGEELPAPNPWGDRVIDDSFLVLFNTSAEAVSFALPEPLQGREWAVQIDTFAAEILAGDPVHVGTQPIPVEGRSLLLLQRLER